jgi:hypothetical protein
VELMNTRTRSSGVWILATPHLRAGSVVTLAAAARGSKAYDRRASRRARHLPAVVRQRRLVTADRQPSEPSAVQPSVRVIEELVPDGLWERLEPLLPETKPRRHRCPGRPRVDTRAPLTGIVFVFKTAIAWAQLPPLLIACSGGTCCAPTTCWTPTGADVLLLPVGAGAGGTG